MKVGFDEKFMLELSTKIELSIFCKILHNYVGDAARLGGPLPKPTIRYSRQAGEGEWFHYIEVYII